MDQYEFSVCKIRSSYTILQSIRQTPFGIRSAGVCFMVSLSHTLTEIDRTIHNDKVTKEFCAEIPH